MRRRIAPLITSIITSPTTRSLGRGLGALSRTVRFAMPTVRYFHQVDDPYSQLAIDAAARLAAAYAVALEPHLVPAPDLSAAPEPERLLAYARRDAALLAGAHGLDFADPGAPADPAAVAQVTARLAALDDPAAFLAEGAALGAHLWRGQPIETGRGGDAAAALAAGAALRARLGHYLGAMFEFEGEWFWGLDRLPHLEARLAPFRRPGAGPLVAQLEAGAAGPPGAAQGRTLDFFLSFRSPYTYIAAARARALAERLGAELRLRFVLPMVMRGLPVPAAKRLYIVRDTKREAERLGLPFGRIADPVGAGAERGLATLHHAIPAGRGPDFAESFLQGVFAEGIDAATDAGLARLAERAGVGPNMVAAALADEGWRAVAEANRAELFDFGLWGVPSFRVDGRPGHWGQDRLWAVERDLLAPAWIGAVT